MPKREPDFQSEWRKGEQNSGAKFVPQLAKVFNFASVAKPSSSASTTGDVVGFSLNKQTQLFFAIANHEGKVHNYCAWFVITAVLY